MNNFIHFEKFLHIISVYHLHAYKKAIVCGAIVAFVYEP